MFHGKCFVICKFIVNKPKEGLPLDSPEYAVLWMQMIEGSSILIVGYLHGTVALWDLEKLVRLHDMPLHQPCPILSGMKLKGAKIESKAAQLSKYKKPTFSEPFSSTLQHNKKDTSAHNHASTESASNNELTGANTAKETAEVDTSR